MTLEQEICLALSNLDAAELALMQWLIHHPQQLQPQIELVLSDVLSSLSMHFDGTYQLWPVIERLGSKPRFFSASRLHPHFISFFCLTHHQLSLDQSSIRIGLGSVIQTHITHIQQAFDQGLIQSLQLLKNAMAKILYLFLDSQLSTQQFDVAKLFKMFQIEHLSSYHRLDNLKRFILQPAVREIRKQFFPQLIAIYPSLKQPWLILKRYE